MNSGNLKMDRVWTATLPPVALDWAVANCLGLGPIIKTTRQGRKSVRIAISNAPFSILYSPTSDVRQAHPVILEKKIGFEWDKQLQLWVSPSLRPDFLSRLTGKTPLVAAMRCCVDLLSGETTEIPLELLNYRDANADETA